MKNFPEMSQSKSPVCLEAPLPPVSKQPQHLLAARSGVQRGAPARVPVNAVHAGGSVQALVPHAVVHVDVAPLPDEAAEALALEIRHGVHAVPVDAGAGLAVVDVGLAARPRPARAAAAAEGVEQVVAGAAVEAGAGGAHVGPGAAQPDAARAGPQELLGLRVRLLGREGQEDPPDLHPAQAAGEILGQNDRGVVLEEVQVAGASLQGHVHRAVPAEQPPGRERGRLLHGHGHAVPGPVRDRLRAHKAHTLDAVPTPDVNKQGGIPNGYLEGIHLFHSPKQNGIFISGSEIHVEAAQSSGH